MTNPIEHVAVEPGGRVRVRMGNEWAVTVQVHVDGTPRLGVSEIEALANDGPALDGAQLAELLANLESLVNRPDIAAALRADQSAEFDA